MLRCQMGVVRRRGSITENGVNKGCAPLCPVVPLTMAVLHISVCPHLSPRTHTVFLGTHPDNPVLCSLANDQA